MIIRKSLYTYGYSEKKRNKILKKMQKNKKVKDLHVVVLPVFQDGLLEIYPFNQLLQPFYLKHLNDVKVIGISKGKDGAVNLVQDIITHVYEAECEFDVCKFFNM